MFGTEIGCRLIAFQGLRSELASKKISQFGRWVVSKALDEGGQGWTYLVAEADRDGDGLRVLKRLKNRGRIGRFRREIEAGLSLSHPNIVRVLDSSPDSDPAFLVSEFCAGSALTPEKLSGKTLAERLGLFRSICEGVAYAHSRGVIHRDIKPDNIFLHEDGTPTVGDFGLCFFEDTGERFTFTEEAVGPRWYMAPELESGRTASIVPASDVYSLGKLLYWILAAKVFARERHREPEYDLSGDGSDFGMKLVYGLLDKMLVEDISERLPNAGAVVLGLDEVLQRIEKRRRAIELARSPQDAASQRGVKVANFRMGSLPKWQVFDPGNATVLGFTVHGHLLAAWGVANGDEGESGCLVWVGGADGEWRVKPLEIANARAPEAAGFQALCPNQRGVLLALVGADREAETGTAYLAQITPLDVAVEEVARDVDVPRHIALASGLGDRVAIYIGGWNESPGRPMGQTLIREPSGESRHSIAEHTNFPGPLAFDHEGGVHQAVVRSSPAGKHEARELRYFSKPPGEAWTNLEVDSTSIRGVFGDFDVEGSMSAKIGLGLTPGSQPRILASSKNHYPHALIIYAKEDEGFSTHEFDLRPIAESYGLEVANTSRAKQLLIDENGRIHIALMSSEGDSSDVLYLAFDEALQLLDHRDFPASEFLGMGLGESGDVYICIN